MFSSFKHLSNKLLPKALSKSVISTSCRTSLPIIHTFHIRNCVTKESASDNTECDTEDKKTEESKAVTLKSWNINTPIWNKSSHFMVENYTSIHNALLSPKKYRYDPKFQFIGGPPGIGKTTAIYQLIQQLLAEKKVVLYHSFNKPIKKKRKLYASILDGFQLFCQNNVEEYNILSPIYDQIDGYAFKIEKNKYGFKQLLEYMTKSHKEPTLIFDNIELIDVNIRNNFYKLLNNGRNTIESIISVGQTSTIELLKPNITQYDAYGPFYCKRIGRLLVTKDFYFSVKDIENLIKHWLNESANKDCISIKGDWDISLFAKYVFNITYGYPILVQMFMHFIDYTFNRKPLGNLLFDGIKEFKKLMKKNGYYREFVEFVYGSKMFDKYKYYFYPMEECLLYSVFYDYSTTAFGKKSSANSIEDVIITLNDISCNDRIQKRLERENICIEDEIVRLCDIGLIHLIDKNYTKFVAIPPVLCDALESYMHNHSDKWVH